MSNAPFNAARVSTVDPVALVRTYGIILLVIGHSTKVGVHGGLNILMLVSGVSFATIAFRGTTLDTVKNMPKFFIRMLAWTYVAIAFWALYFGEFRPAEWFLYHNWVELYPITQMPLWYVQMFAQMFVILAVVFLIFDLTATIKRHPILVTGLCVLLSTLGAVVAKEIWDTIPVMNDRLPHLHIWNFALGWFFWALTKDPESIWARPVFVLVTLMASASVFLYAGYINGDVRFVSLLPAILMLAFVPTMKLPRFVGHPILLVNQATLAIFLLHMICIEFANKVIFFLGIGGQVAVFDDLARIGSGLVMPIILWAAMVAIVRTVRSEWQNRNQSVVVGRPQ